MVTPQMCPIGRWAPFQRMARKTGHRGPVEDRSDRAEGLGAGRSKFAARSPDYPATEGAPCSCRCPAPRPGGLRSLDRRRVEPELPAEKEELLALQLGDRHPAPSITGPNERGEHQLHSTLLIKEPGDDLGPPALLLEAPLYEVRGPGADAVTGREPQVGQGGLQVIGQAVNRRRVPIGVAPDYLSGQSLSGLVGGSVPDGPDVGHE